MTIIDTLRRFRTLSPQEKTLLTHASKHLSKKELQQLTTRVKQRITTLRSEQITIGDFQHTFVRTSDALDDKITAGTYQEAFEKFAPDALTHITQAIAPGITGMDMIKQAAALQLFSEQPIHILLLGDPGTGKTQILSAITKIAPIAAMGLGSGTSSAGLGVTVKGKEVQKGLLPMAHGGICAIDELNLMKPESRASMYTAMQDGFVTYDKGGNHYKFDALVRILATANPTGDKFVGNDVKKLKKQLPFDPALLSRFHLAFLVRKQGIEGFKKIARQVLANSNTRIDEQQIKFLREYITQANLTSVSIPKRLQQDIVEFIGAIKENEHTYLVEVTPRMVTGFERLAKAHAQMHFRTSVSPQDVAAVQQLISASLETSPKDI